MTAKTERRYVVRTISRGKVSDSRPMSYADAKRHIAALRFSQRRTFLGGRTRYLLVPANGGSK